MNTFQFQVKPACLFRLRILIQQFLFKTPNELLRRLRAMPLNPDEKRELLRLIEADQPLPAHWRARLFPGSAQALYRTWDAVCQEFLQHGGYSASLGRSIGYTVLFQGR